LRDLLQVAGALLILAGFAAVQAGRLDPARLPYLSINALGAGVLFVLAFLERQWGFVLLEGTWTAVSLAGMARAAARGPRTHQDAGPNGPASSS
jgi:hypothetical protein